MRTSPSRRAVYLERRVRRLEWQRGSVRWRHAWRRLQREHEREFEAWSFERTWLDNLMAAIFIPLIQEQRNNGVWSSLRKPKSLAHNFTSLTFDHIP